MVEHGALVRAELAIDAGDHLGGAGSWLVPRCTRLDRAPAQPADQLPQPFRGGRPLFIARLAGAGVRQLLRNFGKVDLEVVNKDIVHVFSAVTSNYRSRDRNFCQGQFGGCSSRG